MFPYVWYRIEVMNETGSDASAWLIIICDFYQLTLAL